MGFFILCIDFFFNFLIFLSNKLSLDTMNIKIKRRIKKESWKTEVQKYFSIGHVGKPGINRKIKLIISQWKFVIGTKVSKCQHLETRTLNRINVSF